MRPVLRALRHDPLFVDDQAVAARLLVPASRPRTASEVPAGTARLTAELARWARAWLVCWHAALVRDQRYGLDEPWTIALSLDDVAPPRGIADPGRLGAVLDALHALGVLVAEPAGSDQAGARVRAARDVFAEHPAAVAVDWPTVVAACQREPAALLVVRTLAELIVPLDTFAAVPRRDLVERTGYQQKQVRVALRRLAAAGLLEAESDVGTTGRYRFAPRALGRAWPAVPATAPHAATPPPLPSPVAAVVVAVPRSRDAAAVPGPAGGGMQVVVGGVTVAVAAGTAFAIDPGFSARLEVGEDGGPRLVVVPLPPPS